MNIVQKVSCLAIAGLGAQAAVAQALPHSLNPDAVDLLGPAQSSLTSTGRVQQFFQWDELPGGNRQVTMRGLSFRYDGPGGRVPAVEQVIGRVTILVGVTNHGVDALGAVFDDNLTTPLVTAFDVRGYRLLSDGLITLGPEPWGGPSGQLRFTFPTPAQLTVPQGGCLVVELRIEQGPGPSTTEPARLDAHEDPTDGDSSGYSVAEAQGCGYVTPMMPALQVTDGQYRPGTAFSVTGAGFAPGSIVGTWITTGLDANPSILPGTPGCWSYLDLSTGCLLSLGVADSSGRIGAGEPPLPLPPSPGLCGKKLYIQSAGTAPRTAFNTAGVITSNYRTIRIGCRADSPVRAWHVSQVGDSGARIATRSSPGGLAMRIE